MSSKLTESRKLALYYRRGYATLKEGIVRLENVTLDSINESEFGRSVCIHHLR